MGRNRNNIKLDEFHYHEAKDRAYIIANQIESVLIEHPVIIKHKELKHRLEKAQVEILNVYQMIDDLDSELFPDPKKDSDKQ